MSILSQIIKDNALSQAQAGDWSAVAEILNSPVQSPRTTKAYYTEVYQTLGDADMRHTLRVMAADEIGQAGVARLNDASVDGGMYFAHPITVGLVESLRSQLNPGVADKLLSLGITESTLAAEAGFESVAQEECSAAYLVGADVLLSVNRTNGTQRLTINCSRNGQRIKAIGTENTKTPADVALSAAIDIAISHWLEGGV